MKQRSKRGTIKDLMVLSLILVLCFCIGIAIARRDEQMVNRYSVSNKGEMGYSGLYEVLQKLGFEVTHKDVEIIDEPTEVLYIVVGRLDDKEESACKAWVARGGVLVHIPYSGSGELLVFPEGEGMWLEVGDPEVFTNVYLLEDASVGYDLYKQLQFYGKDRPIIFNEFYLLRQTSEKKLWDTVPGFLKFALAELGVALILYFLYAGRRFGKVRVYVEEVERQENEYVYAVSRFFRKAKAWDLVVMTYYKALENKLSKLTRREEDLLVAWEKEGLGELLLLKEVYEAVQKGSYKQQGRSSENKTYKELIYKIEKLSKVVEKRRETYWKL